MTILSKVKWILGISVVFFLILATNLIDKENFNKANRATTSLYEDRLVAKGILLDITFLLHEKEVAYFKNDSAFLQTQLEPMNASINELISAFEKTSMIGAENRTFMELRKNISSLEKIENSISSYDSKSGERMLNQLELALQNIKRLTAIQTQEGKRQVSHAKKAFDSVKLYTTIEIYMLLALAIIAQFIVIYSAKKTTN